MADEKKMELCREEANREPQYFPWNDETKKRFNLDKEEIEVLEEGSVLWRESTGYSLEEVDS